MKSNDRGTDKIVLLLILSGIYLSYITWNLAIIGGTIGLIIAFYLKMKYFGSGEIW